MEFLTSHEDGNISVTNERVNITGHTNHINGIDQLGKNPEHWLFALNELSEIEDGPRKNKLIQHFFVQSGKHLDSQKLRHNKHYARLLALEALFYGESDPEDARCSFQISLTQCPKLSVIYVMYAQFELDQGRKDKALKILRRGKICVEDPGEIKEAEREVENGSTNICQNMELKKKTTSPLENITNTFQHNGRVKNEKSVPESPKQMIPQPLEISIKDMQTPLQNKQLQRALNLDMDLKSPLSPCLNLPSMKKSKPRIAVTSSTTSNDISHLNDTSSTGSALSTTSQRLLFSTTKSTTKTKPGLLLSNYKTGSGKPIRVLKKSPSQAPRRILHTHNSEDDSDDDLKVVPLNKSPQGKQSKNADPAVSSSSEVLKSLNQEKNILINQLPQPGEKEVANIPLGSEDRPNPINPAFTKRSSQTAQCFPPAPLTVHPSPQVPTSVPLCNQVLPAFTAPNHTAPRNGHPDSHISTSNLNHPVANGNGMTPNPPIYCPNLNSVQTPIPHRITENNFISQPHVPAQQPHPSTQANHHPSPLTSTSTLVQQYPSHVPMFPLAAKHPDLTDPNMQAVIKKIFNIQKILDINGRTYLVKKVIGKGGSSKVYQALEPVKMDIVAIKQVNLVGCEQAVLEGYKREIDFLKKLQGSRYIIKLLEYSIIDKYIYIVMECGSADLCGILKQQKAEENLDIFDILGFWKKMLKAVQTIHQHGIIHLDLKPANFLVVGNYLKLIDFGIANSIQVDATSIIKETQFGTLNYMAPETINDMSGAGHQHGGQGPRFKVGPKADVWSLGCILYNIMYGRTPFQHIRNQAMKLFAITNERHEIEFPDFRQKELIEILRHCLRRDPKKRPSVEMLLNHPLLI